MKLILKNSDLVFKTEVQKVKVFEDDYNSKSSGRFDVQIPINQDWGSTTLMIKATKLTSDITISGMMVYKMVKSEASTFLGALYWGVMSEAFDFEGANKIQLFATGVPASVAQIHVEIYKYDS